MPAHPLAEVFGFPKSVAYQLSFLPDTDRIVNVATVPLRSPFRYPGGKTWLVPRIRRWFGSLPARPAEFVEPFAGGGIIGLTVAFEELADHVTLVELDEQVAAVWQTILHGESEWLAGRILNFELTLEAVKQELSKAPLTRREQAFQTLLKNRVNRGGILAPGAGLIKNGDGGRGLASRWYPQTLSRRIMEIAAIRERLTIIAGDGLELLRHYAARADALFFIDPPYTAAGKRAGSRLYPRSELDHDELFHLAGRLAGDFLMTYSDDEAIRALARRHGFETRSIAMKNTHNTPMTELLVGRNLGWIRLASAYMEVRN
jgi:DNA adenine methylase